MTQTIRQSNLFAAEDWRKIYRAFSNVNFNAYDFDSIKLALVEYLRQNYAEDFTDYIDSSEFIALIDMMAYLGQSLAFRVDLNARENFMDTADRRESILKLAKMLSYAPKRNITARGLVKIMSVRTNDDIYDSNALNLNGKDILWNDPNNPDWFEQFILVMNNIYDSSNPFGQPVEKATIGNVSSHIYRLNNKPGNPGQYGFSARVDNSAMPFELVNISIKDKTFYDERQPDPSSAFHLIYQNDGNGNQSTKTGFFAYFKQGNMRFDDFDISTPIENRVLTMKNKNVNESDVWTQTIDDGGNILIDWTKVPAIEANNVIFNNVDKKVRNIFSVQTLDTDAIAVRFGDGRFGNVPSGLIRVWSRVSANRRMNIRPQDMRDIIINMSYYNSKGLEKRFAMTVALQETVSNSQPSETDEEIRRRAPQVYYTQNRMVTGEDYNAFPLDDTTILKSKALNRTYSGHSRYIDINDPTGQHQNTNVVADDGLLYKEFDNFYEEIQIALGASPDDIVYNTIQPTLKESEFVNFVYGAMRQSIIDKYPSELSITQLLTWFGASASPTTSTGILKDTSGAAVQVGTGIGFLKYIASGGMIKFRNAGWVAVNDVVGTGDVIDSNNVGSISLKSYVATGDEIIAITPAIRTSFSQSEIDNIKQAIVDENTFGIMYDFINDLWFVKDTSYGAYNRNSNVYTPTISSDLLQENAWLVLLEFTGSEENAYWAISTRGLRYVFESVEDVRFFFINSFRLYNNATGLVDRDHVTIFKTNGVPEYNIALDTATDWIPSSALTNISYVLGQYVKFENHYYVSKNNHNASIQTTNIFTAWATDAQYWELVEGNMDDDTTFNLVNSFIYEDGYVEPRKILLGFTDVDQDGIVDDPEVFDKVVFGNQIPTLIDPNYFIHFSKYVSFDGYEYYKPMPNTRWFSTMPDAVNDVAANPGTWEGGDVMFVPPLYYTFNNTTLLFDQVLDPTTFINYVGRADLNFQWKHFAASDHRIDPAVTNIIDVFVLTQEYNNQMRRWIVNGLPISEMPVAESITQLQLSYAKFNSFKMISDQLIWHPVKYKLLFGDRASEELQATIKITRVLNSKISDGEIKANVISAINTYFSAENWDFGEPFYFSELSAYIHQQLATDVGGVALVPMNGEARFGNLYDIKAKSDEIFISCATVNNIEIVKTFTETTLRINK